MSLVLENASFSQELNDTFQQPIEEFSFAGSKRIRNSRRRGSKAITNKKKQIRKAQGKVKHLRVQLRGLRRSIR